MSTDFSLSHTPDVIKWLRHAANPKPGGPYLPASTAPTVEEGGRPPRFRRIYFLAAQPDPRTARKEFLSTVGCSDLNCQLPATILKPFPTTFGRFGAVPYSCHLDKVPFYLFGFSATCHGTVPIGTAPRFWTRGWRRFKKLPYDCRGMAI